MLDTPSEIQLSAQLATLHKFNVRVYYEDTDTGGIVYYANYLKFFERARTEWLRKLNIKQSFFLEQKIGFVVKKVEMDNLASSTLDDELVVVSKISELKRASLIFEQKILNNEQIICVAKIRIACVNLQQVKPCTIPESILGALKSVS